jgi:hypothetical protein
MRIYKLILSYILFPIFLLSSEYSNEALILIKSDTDHIKQFAANELKKHLELILNKKILIIEDNPYNNINNYKYIFYIGQEFLKIKEQLKAETSMYKISNNKIYIYGYDKIKKRYSSPLETVTYLRNSIGTLFSVYDFLYNELNVRWIEPGDSGILYNQNKTLVFKDKLYIWYPKVLFRYFRNDIWRWDKYTNRNKINMYKNTPKELQYTKEYVAENELKELLWMRRMKQGIFSKPPYGHAFTKFWKKYGKNHIEWFALGGNGKRGIEGSKSHNEKRIKLCVTNDKLQNQIVNNWKKSFKKRKNNIYNACINDSKSYCRCKKCRALDNDHKKVPSKDFEIETKTDRYVYFWNQLLKKTKSFNKDAKIIAYAYNEYRYPPKNINLYDDIILGFVPKFNDTPFETKQNLKKWKEKGLKIVFLRPNDFNDDIGMPMGHEEYIYNKLKIFQKLDLYGIDYDRSYNFNNWYYDGISYYIIAQAIINPTKSFETLENEYLEIYKNSKNNIKKFYKYWRDNFKNKRLLKIKENGGFSGRRNMYNNIKDFYKIIDFDITDKFLYDALDNSIDDKVKNRIKRLIIANKHSRYLFIAIKNNTVNDYKKLINFRIKYKRELNLSWPMVFYVENKLSNITGMNKYIKKIINKLTTYF